MSFKKLSSGNKEFDDIKIGVIILTIFILLVSSSPVVVGLVNKSKIFSLICEMNPFVIRMASLGNQPEYALYCYGVASLLMPYFLYIVMGSTVIKASIAKRYEVGGKPALRNSALIAAAIFIFIFFYFSDFSPEHISRIDRMMFFSHFGIAFWSLGLTLFLAIMAACFVLYTIQFFKKDI